VCDINLKVVNYVQQQQDIIAKLTQEFSQDPLYKYLDRIGKTEALFDNHIEELIEGRDYSTTDFENWYCVEEGHPDHLATAPTMRNWQKQLNGYIEGITTGRNVRLNYQSIFRLRMALMLRINGVPLARVTSLVGLKTDEAFVIGERKVTEEESSKLLATSKENDVMRNIVGQMLQSGIIKIENDVPVLRLKEYIDDNVRNNNQLLLQEEHGKIEIIEHDVKELKELYKDSTIREADREQKIRDMSLQAEEITRRLSVVIDDIKDDEEWISYQNKVTELREDAEVRQKTIDEMISSLRDRKESEGKLRTEIIKSLPWFVRMFTKKEP
jgi:hypothetical protein